MRTLVLASLLLALPVATRAQTPLVQPHGDHTGDEFGGALCVTDDLDGDGVPDVLVGAPAESGSTSAPGWARVYSGANGALIYRFATASSVDRFGAAVAASADVDGDGLRDLLVGNPGSAPAPFGAEVRVFKSSTGEWAIGFADAAPDSWNGYGHALADLGDITGDGVPDWAVGAPSLSGENPGFVRLFSGAPVELFDLVGDADGDQFGFSVAGAGDVDLDGVPDVLVGAPVGDYAQVRSGADGAPLLTLPGVGGEFGATVSAAGDISGDGVPDLAVAAPLFHRVDILSGTDGDLVRRFEKFGGEFGRSMVPLGDVNDDLVPDLLVGAPADDVLADVGAGTAFVISGKTGQNLFKFTGAAAGARLGTSAAAGDLDGDGRPEMLLGAPDDVLPDGSAAGTAGVYAGKLAGSIVNYGLGCPGSFLITPRLDLFGDPLPGGKLTVSITNALGGAMAGLLIGTGTMDLPLKNGCIVWGNPLVLTVGLVLDGSFPGEGNKTLVGRLPLDTPLGLLFTAQVLVLDEGTDGGVAGTSAYAVTVQ